MTLLKDFLKPLLVDMIHVELHASLEYWRTSFAKV